MKPLPDISDKARMANPNTQAARHTMLVLLAALLLRVFVVVFVLTHHPHGWFFERGTEMSLMAQSMVHGHGLSSPFGGDTGPTAMFAPLYPMLEALVFRVWGGYTTASAIVLMMLHSVANLVTIWLMMRIARRAFGETTAVVAGLVWTFSLPLWFLPTILWDTSITICLLTGLIALALRVEREPGRGSWLLFGAYCGLTALFNPALMLTLMGVVVVTVVACRRSAAHGARALVWREVALSGAMFLLVFCGWPIRNALVFHAFVPLRTAVGLDVWMGNHAGSTGYLEAKLFPTFNPAELRAYETQGEIAYTNGKMALALDWMKHNPAAFLALTARRFTRFWLGTGTEDATWIFAAHATATTFLGAWGLWRLAGRRRHLALLLAMPLLLFPVPYYVSHAEFRFRLVIDPLMTLLGAYAVVRWFSAEREDA